MPEGGAPAGEARAARLGTEHVRLAVEGPVARLTLARPEKLNALTPAMLAALEEAANLIEREGAVRVAILSSESEKAFCVGADIGEWSALEPLDMWRRWIREGHRTFDRLARLRQPLIAVVNGRALGGGLELAACADLRIVEADAELGLPEVRIGTVPGWSGTQRLVRRVGAQPVKRLALTGETIGAEEALRLGLADEVCPSGQGLVRALELARSIAAPRARVGPACQAAHQRRGGRGKRRRPRIRRRSPGRPYGRRAGGSLEFPRKATPSIRGPMNDGCEPP